MKMQWESARKVDASDCANKAKRKIQLNSISVSERETEFLSVSLKTQTVAWMKMAFNGGCDTDGPHNKRLCTGQNIVSVNDNNNNTNGGGLLSNGTIVVAGGDVDMKGLGLLRVNFWHKFSEHEIHHNRKKSFTTVDEKILTEISHLTLDSFPNLPRFNLIPFHSQPGAANRHFRVKLNLIATLVYDPLSDVIFVITLSVDDYSICHV
jgi:hypothetical protein